ncbi:MAG TPA: hypothetical protein DCQ68_18950 [Chryseobacterium indologenes]|nr:hypothetical protein [Chryseobacterium indologenes]
MQTNDLNIVSTDNWSVEDFANPDSLLSRIRLSPVQTFGRIVTEEEILALSVKIIPPSKQVLAEVKRTVAYYETLGKSRRWIRRYIKRKFNITEY